VNLDYYQRPFSVISQSIVKEILRQPHVKRQSFWSLIPDGEYGYIQSKQLIEAYYASVLKEIQSVISSKSKMYWLHLSRRILPSTSGKDKSPTTVGITRRIIDGAIEKFGGEEFCEHIGITGEIKISEVFDGLLMSPEFEFERVLLEKFSNQVVLTKFNQTNMLEYYTLEKLVYEVWKCGATLRALGKGALLFVDNNDSEFFTELRTPELDFLIQNYDSRPYSFITSRKGVVLENKDDFVSGKLFTPVYNVSNLKVDFFNEIFEKADVPISFGEGMITNFIPTLYPFRGYYNNNKPLFQSFFRKHKTEVVSILTVITSIAYRIFNKLLIDKDTRMVKPLFLRAYEGPVPETEVLKEIKFYKELAILNLELSEEDIAKVDIHQGFEFLKLKDPEIIDLLFTAPLKLFIPVTKERVLIDYSKIVQILDDLMFQVRINDENFKGELFEYVTNKTSSHLPLGQSYALDGSSKQIDYAIGLSKILVICECKLKENSIGYYKGNIESLEQRRINVIEKSINEANEKALWLAKNPIGRNYDVSEFNYILPIGLSAFKEFIPSKNKKYWINEALPRVLTIEEFNNSIDQNIFSQDSFNLIRIKNAS
jgi:hypothetical protein